MTVPTVPLIMLPRGSRARIVNIQAGRGLRRRLMQMGLTPGSEILVLENTTGPVLISVRGVTIALGRGIASKIIVQPLG